MLEKAEGEGGEASARGTPERQDIRNLRHAQGVEGVLNAQREDRWVPGEAVILTLSVKWSRKCKCQCKSDRLCSAHPLAMLVRVTGTQ